MFEIKELRALRGKKIIFENVNMQIEKKTITAIIGKNGSGKSTLVECINQTIPYSGSIEFLGQDVSSLAPRERARLYAILPQSLPAPHITVRELIMLGRSPHLGAFGRCTEEDHSICEDAARITGVSAFLESFADKLSGGERQKVYLAMTFAQNTPFLVFDEPTTYMDMTYESDFMKTLASLRDEHGKTIVAIMHDLNLAVRYADNIAILDSGKLAFFGSRAECIEAEAIENVFGVKSYMAEGEIFYKA